MAPKRSFQHRPPPEDPPSFSSSEEEDEQFSCKEDEENPDQTPSREAPVSESSEEEQEEKNTTKPSLPTPTSKTRTPKTPPPPPAKTPWDSDQGSDSETHSGDTQPSPTASRFTIKPIKDVASPKPKKPTSKPPAAARRLIEDIIEKNDDESQKKKRTTVEVEEEEEKPSYGCIHRLWSEDDEIAILEGMINYHFKKGTDPYSEIGDFHEFIKNPLSIDVSKVKFVDKVRKMKVKYNTNVEKGVRAVFSKPHDVKCFELSKKIWGGGGGAKVEKRNAVNGNVKRGSKKARKTENGIEKVGLVAGLKGEVREDIEVDTAGHFWAMNLFLKQSLASYPFDLSMKEPVKSFMLENMSMIGSMKAKELEKKWKDLVADEVALYLKRVELIEEQTKLIVDAMKASKD